MQLALQPDSSGCDFAPDRGAFAAPRRSKMLVAGVAVASAGVLAVTPIATAPAIEESRKAAVELSAFANPLTTLQKSFETTLTNLNKAGTDATAQATALAETLSKPEVQSQFTGILTAVTNPQRIAGTVAALPGYANRISAAADGLAAQAQEALDLLPGVLQVSAGFLAQGKFLEAYSEINLWFLTAGLSDFRGSLLDAFRVPGDFLDSIGLEPLARILGTTWMDDVVDPQGRPGYGPGLLSRAVIGNFGRAVLGPTVTAIFQTVEIMDALGSAIQKGEIDTAVSELVNAPIKIVNAFVNGYVPAFVTDPNSPIPPGPGQTFPGLLGPTGTVDFFFRQVPAEIVKALNVVRPAPAPAVTGAQDEISSSAAGGPSDIPTGDDTALLKLDTTPEPAPEPAPEPKIEPVSAPAPAPAAAPPAPEVDGEEGTGGELDGTTGSASTGGVTTGTYSIGGTPRIAATNRIVSTPSVTTGGTTTDTTTGGGNTTGGTETVAPTGGTETGAPTGGTETGAPAGGGNDGGESGGGDD